jgi:hypothetical protein
MIDLFNEGFRDDVALAETIVVDTDKPSDDIPVEQAAALGPAHHVEMTVIAQDPKVRDEDGRILRTKVRVAADRFREPFQTHRFHVVSYDPAKAGPGPALRLIDENGQFRDRFVNAADARLLDSHDFHAQNVFAIANRTLAAFESGLGRRVPWDFDNHQLYLVPHGEIRNNANYSASKRALIFGIAPDAAGKNRYSCLSHDIIAHETTHAILDGLRPGYFTPSLPDQGGFHEGFADIVALLSVFAVPAVVDHGLAQVAPSGVIALDEVTRRKLKESVLFQIAEEFGEAVHGRTGRPLRESVQLKPGNWWRTDEAYQRVHNRGEILVASVANVLLDMWLGRLRELLDAGPTPRTLAAEEGAKAAEHLLHMVIRAIDYCPPLEFEYEDFLDAILWSDAQVAPDDEHNYRKAVESGFGRYDIKRPTQQVVEVARLRVRPRYERFNFGALQTDPDEVFRFIWENDELLGISLRFQTDVQAVRPSIRVGPDGFVVRETVVTYTQEVDGTVAELQELSKDPSARHRGSSRELELPADLDPTTQMRAFGGGSLIFDQFGRPKYHFHKPLLDWERQTRRLEFLARTIDAASTGRLGTASSRRDALAAAHRPDRNEIERW